MAEKTTVPFNFGRYLAISEYITGSAVDTLLAIQQPTVEFIKTAKKINDGGAPKSGLYKKHKKSIESLLSELVNTFPSDGLPHVFSLHDQSAVMIGYHKQKDWLYKGNYAFNVERVRIGQMIMEKRKKAGLSQAELAEKIGTKQNNIARIETGRCSTGFDILQKIADVFDMKIDFV